MDLGKSKTTIVALALTLGVGAGCARRETKDDALQAIAVPVAVAEVTTGDIEDTLEVTGTIEAAHDVTISSKIMGKVAAVQAKEGQRVGAGQVLIRLEDRELRAQVKQAEAGLDTAKARLEQSRHGLGIQTEASSAGVVQAETGLATARARLEQALQAKRLQEEQSARSVEQAEAGLEAAKVLLGQAETSKVLTSDTVEAQLQGAQAQLAAAQAGLDKVRTGAREQEKAEADASVAQGQSALDNAGANLGRTKNLFAAGAVSQQQLDAAQLQYDVAKSNHDMAVERRNLVYEGARPEDVKLAETQVDQAKAAVAAAEANARQNELREKELQGTQAGVKQAEAALALAKAGTLQDAMREQDVQQAKEGVAQAESALALAKASTAKTGISEEDVRLAQAGVTQAEAALTLAQAQLDSSRIASPVSGSVAKSMIERGETATPGVPLMRIVARGAVEFRAKVSEIDIRKVSVGQQVKVAADAIPGETFVGSVAEILPAADAATRNFELRVVIPNPQEKLKEGMFARGNILLAKKERAVLLPKDAAVRDERGALHAFVVEGDTVRQRDISVGLQAVNQYEVVSGLSAGEKVVVSGQAGLRDGDKVSVQSSPVGGG